MRDITSIGEALIDLTWTGESRAGVPLYAANPGGAPANVAVAAARLGAQTAFIGKVGRDGFGAQLKRCCGKTVWMTADCSQRSCLPPWP